MAGGSVRRAHLVVWNRIARLSHLEPPTIRHAGRGSARARRRRWFVRLRVPLHGRAAGRRVRADPDAIVDSRSPEEAERSGWASAVAGPRAGAAILDREDPSRVVTSPTSRPIRRLRRAASSAAARSEPSVSSVPPPQYAGVPAAQGEAPAERGRRSTAVSTRDGSSSVSRARGAQAGDVAFSLSKEAGAIRAIVDSPLDGSGRRDAGGTLRLRWPPTRTWSEPWPASIRQPRRARRRAHKVDRPIRPSTGGQPRFSSTTFRRRRFNEVWKALDAIPYGETRSYADVANAIGRPTAVAPWRACATNPVALAIPCHRVVQSGAARRYRWGARKEAAFGGAGSAPRGMMPSLVLTVPGPWRLVLAQSRGQR